MYTVNKIFTSTLEVKRSKFITYLLPYSEFSFFLESIKAEHPKARHFVTAYRYLNEHTQIVEGSSDDGEPKGTSGKASLMVLQGHDLIDVAVVTVRYFGGIKLGTGGLVRAYSDAVNTVIDSVLPIVYKKESQIVITFGYDDIRRVEYTLEKEKIRIVSKKFEEKVTFVVQALKEELHGVLSSLDGVTHIPHWQENTKSE